MKESQLAGATLAVAVIVLINAERREANKGKKKLWLGVLLFASGLSDTMANVFDKAGPSALKNLYLFFTFFAALLTALALALGKRQRITVVDLLCGLLIGILLLRQIFTAVPGKCVGSDRLSSIQYGNAHCD